MMIGHIDFHTLAEHIPTLCWTAGPDGSILWYNRRWYEYTGTTPEQMEGWGWQSVHDPAELPKVLERWRASIATGAPFEMTFPLRDAHGAFQPFLTRVTPTFDASGVVTAWYGVNANISEQVEAESALRRAEAALRNLNTGLVAEVEERTRERDRIWTLIPDLLMVGSLDGRLISVNPAWTDVLGYDETSLLARPFWDLVHPDFIDIGAEIIAKMERGHTVRHQNRVRCADGSYRWFDWVSAPTGQTFYAIARDITERKMADEALGAAKRESDEARAQAEAANAAKSDFLASMSHEIRTPLHGILGYADLLRDAGDLTDLQSQRIERLQSAGNALLTIVDDVLDFSKIEAGRVELEHLPFSMHGMIDNTTSMVHSSAESRGLKLVTEVDPQLPDRLLGDQDRLRQILLNLLNNAIKFTAVGSVTLRVLREPSGSDLCGLKFAVEDTGIGIPRSKVHRLFERFSQVDGSIRRDFGGTGLGLAISKRLVEQMGGEIGVDSEEGRGSTFYFSLALPVAVAEALSSPPSALEDDGIPSRGVRILVVEDVEINQDIVRAVLEKANHVVAVVSDGVAAIKAVQSQAYDVVLMDVQMPGMDGITATQHIRALSHPASKLPIIAMTANVLPQQIAQFRLAGMDDHVGKPFKRDELYAAVARWGAAGTPSSPPGEPRGEKAVEP